jgi:ATP-binding cassette, subfamily B, bacterial
LEAAIWRLFGRLIMKKISTNKETLKLFWGHAKRYPGYVAGLLISTPITILCHQFIPPLIVAAVLERLASGDFNPNDWWGSFGSELLLYAAITYFSGVLAWRIVIWFIWQLEIRVKRDLYNRVFTQLMKLDSNFHANNFGGSLVSQTNKFVGAYVTIADTTLFDIYTFIFALTFSSFILWSKAPLFVIAMLALVAFFVVVAIFISKKIRELNTKEAEAGNKLTGFLADAITNVAAVKSFSHGKSEQKRFMGGVDNWVSAERRVMRASLAQQMGIASVTSTMGALSLVLGVVSVVVFKADASVVFLTVAYTNNIAQRLWEFSQRTLRNYNRALGDSKAMVEILHREPAVKDVAKPKVLDVTKGAIAFNDMTFAHADSKNDVLFTGLNLKIAAGKKIGLVGHSGSGKTTLTRLLLRFANIQGGSITVDGQDIAKVSQDDLRRSIAYVPQEPLLFHRSLRDNIAYGKPDATEEEIHEAARKAHAAEFIEKLPNGYDTEVGERGVKLSGGQRQRIAIARAIIKDAPILVLDEATSALDSESEKLIQSALWELMKGRTAIVIAHRLSTIQRMDEIVVLDDGKILEKGSHDTLLKKGGVYAELWAHQSGGFIQEDESVEK